MQSPAATAVLGERVAMLRVPGGTGAGPSTIELPRHPRQRGRVQQSKGL